MDGNGVAPSVKTLAFAPLKPGEARLAFNPFPVLPADIAAKAEVSPDALNRVLRLLTYSDVFTQPEPGVYANTPVSELLRTAHPLGDVLSFSADDAVLQSYFRNNILHLFACAAWVACCFQNNRRMSRAGVARLGRRQVVPRLRHAPIRHGQHLGAVAEPVRNPVGIAAGALADVGEPSPAARALVKLPRVLPVPLRRRVNALVSTTARLADRPAVRALSA